MLNKELTNYVKTNIFPLYDSVDSGHNFDFHIKRVVKECLDLAKKLGNINLNMIYVVAAYHDLGLLKDREKHHLFSRDFILADKNLLKWFSKDVIKTIAEAAEDHRASNNVEPRSIYGKIVADCDRIDNLEELLVSVYRTINKKHPELNMLNSEEAFEKAYEWITSKNAKNGYLKYYVDHDKAKKHEKMQKEILNKDYIREMYFKVNNLK